MKIFVCLNQQTKLWAPADDGEDTLCLEMLSFEISHLSSTASFKEVICRLKTSICHTPGLFMGVQFVY